MRAPLRVKRSRIGKKVVRNYAPSMYTTKAHAARPHRPVAVRSGAVHGTLHCVEQSFSRSEYRANHRNS